MAENNETEGELRGQLYPTQWERRNYIASRSHCLHIP